jgi:methionyl-tRNA formyltransferase
MLIDEGMDTGELLAIDTTPVSTEETTPSLTEKLIRLSDDLLTKNIPLYIEGEISPYGQPNPENATYSRKLTKADGIIDWSKPANIIDCEIRAFLEWPKSRTSIAGKDIIVTKSHYSSEQIPDAQLGKAMVVNSKELGVVTSKGTLWIDELKPAGKKQMSAEAFIAGHGHLL